MKIVAIIGSPRGIKGNTGALLNLVLEGAERSGASTEVVEIKGREVKPCLACDVCHMKGVCPQKDSYNTIKEKVMAADGLVLATPNYIFHVSAQLKSFIDRCCGVVHCLDFEGKYGASVVTSGGGDEEGIAGYMNHFMAITGVTPVGSVWATMGQIEGQDFPENLKAQARALGEKLVTAWKNKETNPEYSETSARFRERMKSLILWRKAEWPYEYEYWKKHKGLKE